MVKITNQIYTRKLQHSVIMRHKKIRLNVVLAERQKCTLQEISTCCLGELRIADAQGVSTAPALEYSSALLSISSQQQ